MEEKKKIQLGTGTIKLEIATKYGNFGARSQKTGKLLPTYQDCTETWKPGISARTGSLVTGLTKDEEDFFEEELGLEEGTLKKSSRYWDNFKIKVPSEGITLDLSDAMSYLKYKLLTADKMVANSNADLKANPYCEYIMIRESEKAENESSERRIKIQSYGILDRLTAQDYQDIYLIKNGASAEDVDLSIVKNDVEKYAENSPKQFVSLFTDKDFSDKVTITKFIQKKIITKTGRGLNSPLYFNDVFLGNNVEECMNFLKQSENNSIFVEIMRANKNASGGSTYSLSDQMNSFEQKEIEEVKEEPVLTENEKLLLEVERLKAELAKKKGVEKIKLEKVESKHPKDVITEEMDTSLIERDKDTGFSADSAAAASTIEEVETEVVEKPKTTRGRPKNNK